MGDFGRRHYETHSHILNLDQLFKRRCHLKRKVLDDR